MRRQVLENQFGVVPAARLLRDNFRELEDALGPRLRETLRDIEKLTEERIKEWTDRGREAARRIREVSGNQ